ncbi:response regulator transcription factor [Myxococcaceae bacterium JPH2]|nr:response regulator transcription factor [Myxococcaceae bacterium JPH2]
MIRTLIVEDSELARFELEHQLRAHPQIQLVGQADDIDSAEALIEASAPDLILLDIDLPGGNAFQLLERLEHIPPIIFTTAFEQYALAAFEFNTVDYLLKPIKPERLAKALARVPAEPVRQATLTPENQIFVKDGERCFLVKLKDIRCLEAVGNYTQLYFGTNSPLLYRSLNKIEERLDPNVFFRASRQHLVNLGYVEHVEPWSNGGLRLTLRGGQEIDVSRRQSGLLKQLLSL